MNFTLTLVPTSPDEFVLYAEKPLSGLAFVEAASGCLRRNLDSTTKMRHSTLGNVASYKISVPQAIAIESGWFENKADRYIRCEAGFLDDYIFHGASMSTTGTKRTSYPFYQGEVVLSSYVDELAVLDTWRSRGYPETLTVKLQSNGFQLDLVADADDIDNPNIGDTVLDDLLN